MKGLKGSKGKYIEKGVPIILTQRLTQRSIAATAYSIVVSLAPANSTEFGFWADVFDEMICDKVVFKYTVTTAGAVVQDNLFGAMGFDPLNSTVYSGLAAACNTDQSVLFPFVNGLGIGTGPQCNVDTKMRQFVMKITRGQKPGRTTSASTNVSGEWSATSDSADTYGFLKPYFEAGTTGVITSVCGVLFFHCRFRSRT